MLRRRSNSTVVRCKLPSGKVVFTKKVVQIPPWFDANVIPWRHIIVAVPVQIPPWFDANYSGLIAFASGYFSFKFHRGSMQTEKTEIWEALQETFKFHRGSMQTCIFVFVGWLRFVVQIPPWFDANGSTRGHVGHSDKFKFHRGSMQTTQALGYVGVADPFKFHRGSMQTAVVINASIASLEFKFHRGSMQTAGATGRRNKAAAFKFHRGSMQTCYFFAASF